MSDTDDRNLAELARAARPACFRCGGHGVRTWRFTLIDGNTGQRRTEDRDYRCSACAGSGAACEPFTEATESRFSPTENL